MIELPPRSRAGMVLLTGPRRAGKTRLFRHLAGLPANPAAGGVPGVDFCRLDGGLCVWDYNGAPPVVADGEYAAELHVRSGRVWARRPGGELLPENLVGALPPSAEACSAALARLLLREVG